MIVTALCPGATDINFFEWVGAENTRAAYGAMSLADPKEVVKDGYEAFMKRETQVISGVTNKIQAIFTNITPSRVIATRVRRVFEAPSK